MKYLINNLKTSWYKFLNNEFGQEYLKNIDEYLYLNQDKIIHPNKNLIFRAYNFFDIKDTKVVIFGQDPYHNINQANGLCFSVNNNIKLPPSLKNIFKKLNLDLNINRINGDLSDWARQGFLLLNTSLTVFNHNANSHSHLQWNILIKHTIEELNNNSSPILFICFGNFAKQIIKYVDLKKHHIILWPHPSPLSAYRCGFFNHNLFRQIDDFLYKNYNLKMQWK